MSLKNPYASFLDKLEKPARYIGGEQFIVRKNWNDCIGKMALCFPDTYEIGMSHLGMKILYEEINQVPNLIAERCFAPWLDMEKELRERNLNLVTLENFKALKEFDVVGFSLQYEMSYTNILTMMDLGGITLLTNDRGENEPFVICGGPCATHPEPLADFMDMVVIGDGEKLVPRIVHFIGEARIQGWKRDQILLELGKWVGIYVPKFYEVALDEKSGLEYVTGPKKEYAELLPHKIKRFIVESLKDYPFPTKSPIPHMTAIFDRFSVELARGCTEGCRFCQAGMIYRPVRERKPENVVSMVMEGLKNGGFDEASLTCLSTADYSAVTPLVVELIDKLVAEKATLGISSLRAYGLDNRILDKMASVKNSSLTFAPEAGSQRMRDVINKNISEADMMNTAKEIFSRGWSKMKLYFMIGLPTEEDQDVIEIMETGRKAREVARSVGVRTPELTISVSSFVPKPHTPFQWASMITLSEIERKQNLLKDYAVKYRLNFRKHYSKISYLEGIVSRGDRRVGKLILEAWKQGARFDGWDDAFKFDLWIKCLEESGLNPDYFLGTIPVDSQLPWDHIDVGLTERFLELEWKKAVNNRLSPPCGKVAGMIVHHSDLESLSKTFDIDKKKLVCYHCGIACDLKEMVEERREFLTELKAVKYEAYIAPEKLKKDILDTREKRGQFIGHTYRIEYSKVGPLTFISHLDLQKIMSRIFKRAKIEILFSEGYKLRPLLSFGPALALGINSLTEFFDVRVPYAWENPEEMLKELQKNSETGIIFKAIKTIDKNSDSIQDAAKAFEYFIPVNNPDKITEAVMEINNAESVILNSYSKAQEKYLEKNVKPFILEVTPSEFEAGIEVTNLINEVSPVTGFKGVKVRTAVHQGTGIRPVEIVQVMDKFGLKVERPIKTAVLI